MRQTEETPSLNPAEHPYFALFNRHLTRLREHLVGVSHHHASISPSTVGGILWSVEEKEAFFHALSTYSRFRPDLIAGCIETKNEVEVLEYLVLLEEGSRSIEAESCRPQMPISHEVSDSWISWEEENAERLMANEEVWAEGSGISVVGVQGRIPEANVEQPIHSIDSSSGLAPLNGIKRLTYDHLFVLDSMLKRDGKKHPETDQETLLSTPNSTTSSTQSVTEVGFAPPIRMPQQIISPTMDDSLEFDSLDDITSAIPQPVPMLGKESEPTHLHDLSPQSRRRYQKRMHMRRKRALLKGEEVDLTMDNLQSGPRRKLTWNTSEPTIETLDGQNTDSELTADAAIPGVPDPINAYQTPPMESSGEGVNGHSQSAKMVGARVKYKNVRTSFARHNVAPEAIVASGLDIFNFSRLGKLSRQFISVYDSSLANEDASISAEALHLLFEILKDFLVQLISRVVVLEEEHRRLRGTTKVWRKNIDETQKGTIDTSAIQFALKTMGITNENTNQYFADLLGEECDPPSHYRTGYDDNERLVTSRNVLHQHALHQDLCPPHHYHVPEQGHPRLGLLTGDTHDLMDIDTDETRLVEELEDEDLLDEEDAIADQKHEKSLWKEVPFKREKTH
ncbi:hypothetical protein P691DRAFT_776104 [Macrolepiota fuliginosa MF-IS2]|uniref:Uncharacterized protein n=1 Tax=Macrolepiota fuliginosa MF-IS2 TaxID=1400762 RepID=A0A9P6C392_9AGAR|nr:hypothetical protein P691DRAFT_776104 [Macrolepiota fuliginosa MF-IS2]